MTGDATNTSNLTAREVEILCAMCKAMKSKPDVDMQLFATLANFSTPGSATTNLNKALKKAKAMGGPAPPEASNEGCARKRKTAAEDSNEEDAAGESPSKTTKKKKGGTGKGKASAETEEGEDVVVKDEKEGSEGADELA